MLEVAVLALAATAMMKAAHAMQSATYLEIVVKVFQTMDV